MEFTDINRHLIDDGFDLGIKVGASKDKPLNRQTLFKGNRCIVGSRAYLGKRDAIRTPKDLGMCDWVVFTGAHAKMSLKKTGVRNVRIEPKGQIYADSSLAVYQLVKAGAGIAIVPGFLTAEDVANGIVEVLLPDWEIEALDVFAEWPANAPEDGNVRLFVSALAEVTQAYIAQQSPRASQR